jgi:hypothetical protein
MRIGIALLAIVALFSCRGAASDELGSARVTVDRPSGVVADGADHATINTRLLDRDGQPMKGVRVTFAATGSADVVQPETAETNAQGAVSATLSSTVAETKTVLVSFPDLQKGVASAERPSVEFIAGPATTLRFRQQPGVVQAGAVLTPPVTLELADAHGNVAAGNAEVTLSLADAALGGMTSVQAQEGVATFADLSVDRVGEAYQLSASSPGFASATSDVFAVTAAAPAKLAFVGAPVSAKAGEHIPGVLVALEDAQGNILRDAKPVTITSSGTATLGGTRTVTTVNGVAAWTDLHLELAGTYTLTATAPNVARASSASFAISAAAPSGAFSFFSTFDTVVVANGSASATLRLIVRDAWSNLIVGHPVTLTATGGATLSPAADWITDNTGTLAATVSSTQAKDSLISADLGGGVVMTTAVHFIPGAVSQQHSAIYAQTTGGLATITLQARDANQNLIPGLDVSLEVTVGQCTQLFPAAAGATNTDGVFVATLACGHTETDTVVATFGNGGTLTTDVAFVVP